MKRLARPGVKDLGTGYYMALPGTQLFRTLCLQGRIRLDRRYFEHILEGLAVVPARSYCSRIGRLGLFYWKLRLCLAFYDTRLRGVGVLSALREAGRAMGTESPGGAGRTASPRRRRRTSGLAPGQSCGNLHQRCAGSSPGEPRCI